jgi:zinc protease
MKKLVILILAFLQLPCFSQIDRSRAPEPGPAPVIAIGDYELFEMENGLKVILVEDHKIPKVTYSLFMDYDPILENEKTGYVAFAGELIGTATQNRTKDQIDEEIDFIGAGLSVSSGSVYASALKKHNEKLLEVMSDIVLNAIFNENELKKIKKQTLSSIEAGKKDPASISAVVTSKVLYGEEHPYGEKITEENVANITLEDCENFYKKYWKPNISYMVIVGDMKKNEAEETMKTYFADWEPDEVPNHDYDLPKPPSQNNFVLVDRDNSVQSVIKVGYPIDFKPGATDYIQTKVMNMVLGGGPYRLFDNLREKHGYTYGAYSKISTDEYAGKFIASTDVGNEVTDSAVIQILYEMRRIHDELISEEELERVKNNISGSFALALEKPRTVAQFALNIEKYNLPKDYYKNYLKRLDEITVYDVKSAAEKYMHPESTNIVIVGKASEIADKLILLDPDSQLEYYGIEGNKIEKK